MEANMKLRILIIDDSIISGFLTKFSLFEIGYINVEVIQSHYLSVDFFNMFCPDLIFANQNIYETLEKEIVIKIMSNDIKIILIADMTYDFKIEKVLKINPSYLISRPIRIQDLIIAIDFVFYSNQPKPTLIIKVGHQHVKIYVNEIVYIKSDNIYIDVFTVDKKYTLRMTLDVFTKQLPQNNFKRVHRSYVVNTDKIIQKTAKFVYIENLRIPLSRKFKQI